MKRILLLLHVTAILIFMSCSKNDNPSGEGDGNAKVQLVLTDAPAAYDAVYVNIKEVKINVGTPEAEGVPEGSANGQWVNYPLKADFNSRINLLDLRNGDYMYMGEPMSLPAGKITQIRLILQETGNAVVINGVEYPLTTPSAQQSGLKINFNQTLAPDGIYKIWLDFDAARSIVVRGNGDYNLKPVIKASLESATFGAISGFVLPSEAKTTVYLKQGADTIASAIPEIAGSALGEGFFKFTNLNAGTYSLSLNADDATMYKDSTIASAIVTAGKVTSVGTSTLHK